MIFRAFFKFIPGFLIEDRKLILCNNAAMLYTTLQAITTTTRKRKNTFPFFLVFCCFFDCPLLKLPPQKKKMKNTLWCLHRGFCVPNALRKKKKIVESKCSHLSFSSLFFFFVFSNKSPLIFVEPLPYFFRQIFLNCVSDIRNIFFLCIYQRSFFAYLIIIFLIPEKVINLSNIKYLYILFHKKCVKIFDF
jgi:hypothetical protein